MDVQGSLLCLPLAVFWTSSVAYVIQNYIAVWLRYTTYVIQSLKSACDTERNRTSRSNADHTFKAVHLDFVQELNLLYKSHSVPAITVF
jgi:hypothetical protein